MAATKNVTTGDTLCDEDKPVLLENIDFPAPVISVAIEPKTKADQEKMGTALGKLAQEDPTFRVHTDHDTNQTHSQRARSQVLEGAPPWVCKGGLFVSLKIL